MKPLGLLDTEGGAAAFTALSDHIFELAEPTYGEYRSAAVHRDLLAEAGFRITDNVGGIPTAFVAEAGAGGPVIAILGEYDALPGLNQQAGAMRPELSSTSPSEFGHGCGHHLLGSAAHRAAVLIKRELERTGAPGRVRFYGCPAEEGGGGKTFMVRAGAFHDVDAAVTWHPSTRTKVASQSCLAMISVRFRFHGQAAHASTTPHLGRSALDAVELMNVGVQYLREHIPQDARVHYAVTNTGGGAPNVVQAFAESYYYVRSPQIADAMTVYERVQQVAQGAAMMTGTRVEVLFETATSNYVPNAALGGIMDAKLQHRGAPAFDAEDARFADALAATLTDQERAAGARGVGVGSQAGALSYEIQPYCPEDNSCFPGSTDVGDVSWVTPTVKCWVACYPIGTVAHSWQWVSAGKGGAAHKGMLLASDVMADTALALFGSPEVLAAAKAELAARIGPGGYVCPIPPEVKPPILPAAAA